MEKRATLRFIGQIQLYLILICIIFLSNFNLWTSSVYFEFFLLIFSFEGLILFVAVLSLFSKPSDHEGLLWPSVKSTPFLVQTLSWIFLSAFSTIFVFADLIPFPSALIFLLATFSWVGSIVAMFSQRIFLLIFCGIVIDDDERLFSLLNRYLTCILFGFIYSLTSRMINAPLILRKLLSILVSAFCLLLMMLCVLLFE